MLNTLDNKDQAELCQLLIIAFYEGWDEDKKANRGINKKACSWIKDFACKHPQISSRLLAIVASMKASKWLRKLMQGWAEKAASPFSSPAVVEAARTKLMSIVTIIDENGTSKDELVVSRMFLD